MIAPNGKPVICEELTWKDADKLTKTTKMAIISTAACKQHSRHLPLRVYTIDCYEVAKRISQQTGVPATIDKIVILTVTILVKFLMVIVFVQKKLGGAERTI
jgi:creatinine amidohydrolase/Fe(II)-dependent formamide hydrolase-like protein